MDKYIEVLKAQIPGIVALFIAGFLVIAIILEITWKKACDSIAEKTGKEYAGIKTAGSLILALLMSTYAGFGAVKDGILPGGVLLTALWIGLTFVFQYFGSLYAIKGVKLMIKLWRKKMSEKGEKGDKIYVEKETLTKKYRISPDGTKEYL